MSSPAAAIEEKPLGEQEKDSDSLYHLFCKKNPNETRKARCGKTKDKWIVTGSYNASQLCRVCWEMWQQGECSHCIISAKGGN